MKKRQWLVQLVKLAVTVDGATSEVGSGRGCGFPNYSSAMEDLWHRGRRTNGGRAVLKKPFFGGSMAVYWMGDAGEDEDGEIDGGSSGGREGADVENDGAVVLCRLTAASAVVLSGSGGSR
ncbi:hypothetical protein L1887_02780 [Cichorium endivia]|nr:hypothetical protein L1887_02780 [Cichorium endivia]